MTITKYKSVFLDIINWITSKKELIWNCRTLKRDLTLTLDQSIKINIQSP